MLTRATFRGFKALAEVDIDLEPLTVLVGPNASGKSSVLEGLGYVLATAQTQGAAHLDQLDFDRLRTRPDASEIRVQVQASGGRPERRASFDTVMRCFPPRFPVVYAGPAREIEAWILAGYEPLDADEQRRLDELRERGGGCGVKAYLDDVDESIVRILRAPVRARKS